MSTIGFLDSRKQAGLSVSYRRLSLRQLIEQIVASGDSLALEEFHNRRSAFHLDSSPPLVLANFVPALSHTSWAKEMTGNRSDIQERACDLTMNKFSLVPADKSKPGRSGIDCRRYFRGFLRRIDGELADHESLHVLSEEAAVARSLQEYVIRHFYLSCMEAKRSSNPTRSRYAWRVDGAVLYLWMPVSMAGLQRRAWLEENIGSPDPSRPGEKTRVQSIIDEHFGIARHMPLDSKINMARLRPADRAGVPSALEESITIRGLASIIADEKADNIGLLRPAIRALGREKLHGLILRIFEAFSDGCYEEKTLARVFGLSRPTFCRFAGSQWRGSDRTVPDLWRNVAHTLARHTSFTEAAREAGVWERVAQTLAR